MVKLPNGHHVHATHSGVVHLSTAITLLNVLYIPTFTFNLISISKLVSSTNCTLIFSSTSCTLQDMNNRMKIGTVEVRHDLYHLTLDQITTKAVCSTIIHPLSYPIFADSFFVTLRNFTNYVTILVFFP